MAIRTFRPYAPGTRTRVVTDFSEVTGRKPERSLVVAKHRRKGRNNRGVITCRHRGGGHKRQYRIVDFRRNKHGVPAKVAAIHYDPHRNARLALLFYARAFRFGTYVLTRVSCSVSLSERMTASDQCDGLFVVHRHSTEGFTDIPR